MLDSSPREIAAHNDEKFVARLEREAQTRRRQLEGLQKGFAEREKENLIRGMSLDADRFSYPLISAARTSVIALQ
jgi:hypothetical protein